ncbi:uncharacterized protein LOC142110870 [Mixophyes fleayi]|uniref:uncharacterized protein LOC142110870 n=1 Tax=Mixophyes fleayi TaxID=3061075 RepID=UPI003F4D95FB
MASTPETLLLAIDKHGTIIIGPPPKHHLYNFHDRAAVVGKLSNVSRIACSPDGELFCVRGTDLYRGPIPTNKDVDWFSVARRVGKCEWEKFKILFFHPNGDLYGTTSDGDFYRGPKPDNENISWCYEQATLIGDKDWNQFDSLFFDPEGVLYAVTDDKLFKAEPPSTPMDWLKSSTTAGKQGWGRLTKFMAFSSDGKLWSVDKNNGTICRGSIPEDGRYLDIADRFGSGYTCFPFLSFTVDKTIHNIISFSLLPEKGERVSETTEVIEEEIADNRRSSSVLKHNFTIVDVDLLKANSAISVYYNPVDGFTERRQLQVTFSSSSNIELKPGEAVRIVASVVKAEINVPYRARVRTLFGFEAEIEGMWKGVSHYNLMVTQEDYKN